MTCIPKYKNIDKIINISTNYNYFDNRITLYFESKTSSRIARLLHVPILRSDRTPISIDRNIVPVHFSIILKAAFLKRIRSLSLPPEFTKQKFAYCAYRRLRGCTACEDPLQQERLGTNTDGRTSSGAFRWANIFLAMYSDDSISRFVS